MISKNLLQRAKNITRHFGRGFYRASFLFDKKTRHPTWLLYAFVRIPDEMVDTEKDREKGKKELIHWINNWELALKEIYSEDMDPLMPAVRDLFIEYKIPFIYAKDFLDIIMSDFYFKGIETYKDLESYMYGSASVVGIMMSYIIGFKEGALPYAKTLGEALQFINFIRDMGDDYTERNRIYFPKDEMIKFGINESYFKNYKNDENWKNFIIFQINRARNLLEEGKKGIPLLESKGRKAVYAASFLYEELLNKIEKNNYDTISSRIKVSPFKKTMIILKSICKTNL